jgi:hypothetical protein
VFCRQALQTKFAVQNTLGFHFWFLGHEGSRLLQIARTPLLSRIEETLGLQGQGYLISLFYMCEACTQVRNMIYGGWCCKQCGMAEPQGLSLKDAKKFQDYHRSRTHRVEIELQIVLAAKYDIEQQVLCSNPRKPNPRIAHTLLHSCPTSNKLNP